MKKFYTLLIVLGFSLNVLAETVYCPSSVTCKNRTCTVEDNDTYWIKPTNWQDGKWIYRSARGDGMCFYLLTDEYGSLGKINGLRPSVTLWINRTEFNLWDRPTGCSVMGPKGCPFQTTPN